ncbi:Nucleoside-diphosphate-sugar epimerase [Chitinophaga terrae (ex Kim and Jung 2007)]|uniref:Nucleoside-diphosphate-sugar epimerase n=1 Tax=Chitinophaga terrae (ex Kim and Jung 2007) TaxID=408074 RepID=A0A1H4EN91_9BACT|nr:NAD-dependent epimerase/dehydratase family protein [Chitinophaga terrae (ex Kim and Jung 2007)]MDQ0107584.1 nucleoside-diphosphate-sugar epimerase [Chitinophaga terrae (ex Kim and Jung 2007)]GEP91736.1 NAD-dependent dehydratase [Chitinophaga terrae (ex Kim and Jung 2007)]SEA86138.1 Nucleoside-diphosphate-sugar epimerase [Chitinophaga terrae (ex Kim and Jung 2007)]
MGTTSTQPLYTILGAGGVIANELTKTLIENNKQVRLVSRSPKSVAGVTDLVAADLTDAASVNNAVAGSSVVFLTAGLKYDIKVWKRDWPVIMTNVINACKNAGAKLIFFDNVYSYGLVEGPMTEETPYRPSSKKGEVRAAIATQLMNEVKAGNITAIIARSADFYGPGADKTGFLNILIIDKFKKNSSAMWLGRDDKVHSYTYTPDAGKGLYLLSQDDAAWNQVWHLPTANPAPDGKGYIDLIAKEMNVKPKYMKLGGFMLGLSGLFDTTIREMKEMLYQNNYDYIFDSSKFEKHFNVRPTPYQEGIRASVK